MPFMEWESSFELAIKEIDEHHKHLVSLLNMAYDGVIFDASYEELGAVLNELVAYATYHFVAEEHWMEKHKYPELSQHKAEHEQFSDKVEKFQKSFQYKGSTLPLEVLEFIHNWLRNHILKSDADYGRFAKGLSYEA